MWSSLRFYYFLFFRLVCGFIVYGGKFCGFIVFEGSFADNFFVCSFSGLLFLYAFLRIYCFCTQSCGFIVFVGRFADFIQNCGVSSNANFETFPGSVPASSDTMESDSDRLSRVGKRDRKKCQKTSCKY